MEIPSQLKSSLTIKGELDKSHKLQNLVGEQLVGCGFNEILNNSLTKTSYYDDMETYKAENLVKLMNPLSADLGVLRQTLLFGGLECISHNTNRKMPDLKFFEFGNCYYYDATKKSQEKVAVSNAQTSKTVLLGYSEDYHLGLWVTGKRVRGSWAHPDEDSSVYELKAYVMNILRRVGIPFGGITFTEKADDIWSTSTLVATRDGKMIVRYGIVSKKQTKKADVDAPVYFADFNWNNLMRLIKGKNVAFREIPKFPAVSRDLALLIDKNVEFAQIEAAAYGAERKLLREVKLFDVYEGKNLESGKKSYAVNFTLQSEEKTLNDKAIEAVMAKIEQAIVKATGAAVRGK